MQGMALASTVEDVAEVVVAAREGVQQPGGEQHGIRPAEVHALPADRADLVRGIADEREARCGERARETIGEAIQVGARALDRERSEVGESPDEVIA